MLGQRSAQGGISDNGRCRKCWVRGLHTGATLTTGGVGSVGNEYTRQMKIINKWQHVTSRLPLATVDITVILIITILIL